VLRSLLVVVSEHSTVKRLLVDERQLLGLVKPGAIALSIREVNIH